MRGGVQKHFIKDYQGRWFGDLYVLGEERALGTGVGVEFMCLCVCGTKTWVPASRLLCGRRVSCGGCVPLGPVRLHKENAVGLRSGRLKVVDTLGLFQGRYWVLCRCDCGNLTKRCLSRIASKKLSSCGVCRSERVPATHHPEYSRWRGIRRRTKDPTSKTYAEVDIYPLWKKDFWAFADYVTALPNYGKPGYTLDRKAGGGSNYEPDNLRWASPRDQGLNRGTTIYCTHPETGELLNSRDITERTGLAVSGAIYRIHLYNKGERSWDWLLAPVAKRKHPTASLVQEDHPCVQSNRRSYS